MSKQHRNHRTPPSSWLEDRLARLNAVYRRFGRDGLHEYTLQDVSLLLAAKELEYRDAPKGQEQSEAQKAENRRLELEINDLSGHVSTCLALAVREEDRSASGYDRALEAAIARGKSRPFSKDKDHER